MNKRLTLEQALEIVSKEEIEEFYKTHNRGELFLKAQNDWHIGSATFKKVLKYYGITKSKEDSIETAKATCLARYGRKHGFNYDKYKVTMSNKSEEEIEAWKSKISNSIHLVNENLTEEQKLHKHNALVEAAKSRSEDVERERIRKGIETKITKYGPDYVSIAYEKGRDKLVATNLGKYGVPYYCMTEDCKSAYGGYSGDSKPNLNFLKLLEDNGIEYTREFALNTYSYDFKVGDILIEINPTATHNSTWGPFDKPISPTYHFEKTKIANDSGFRCIHVWDWDNLNAIIGLLKPRDTIYARKCEVREVPIKEAKEFINNNHIQGYARDAIRLGLFFDDELVSIMTFDKPRYNKNYEYELVRYCSSKNVIGGAEKLFKHFLTLTSAKSVCSYCDNSKFNGETYLKLGFKKVTKGAPSIHWYNTKTQKHITDNLLRQRGFDQLFNTDYGKGRSNEELMLESGFVKIYDCGQSTYVIKLKED